MGTDRHLRSLVVDGTTWRWAARQHVDRSDDANCRLALSLYREGTRRRLALVFRPGPDRVISNSAFEAGALIRLPDRAYPNLHRPGTVRALLDAAPPGLVLPATPGTTETDGWPHFDTVVGQGHAA
ncbi:hypothetical protein [Streptomyces sp. PT12]|uniref:hypothetical protein n=1 Tax=Streptomyces sp. PT12 TaxID=1510197 RepID=UPI000DE33305|nr:hypothetical protein [Streptomyces sp. PT12]RBM19718.1 hypothetical protein DEH69_09465 [Streptomyces sp. PT12]